MTAITELEESVSSAQSQLGDVLAQLANFASLKTGLENTDADLKESAAKVSELAASVQATATELEKSAGAMCELVELFKRADVAKLKDEIQKTQAMVEEHASELRQEFVKKSDFSNKLVLVIGVLVIVQIGIAIYGTMGT